MTKPKTYVAFGLNGEPIRMGSVFQIVEQLAKKGDITYAQARELFVGIGYEEAHRLAFKELTGIDVLIVTEGSPELAEALDSGKARIVDAKHIAEELGLSVEEVQKILDVSSRVH